MTQRNVYIMDVKLPETATVSYYDVETGQNLTQEEWGKLSFLNFDEDITFSQDNSRVYISEKAFNKGVAVYGPNWWDDWGKDVTKKVGSIALATTYFTPAVVVTGPLTAGVLAGGATAWTIGQITDEQEMKDIGGDMFGFAFDAAVDGLSCGTLSVSAPAIARLTKATCQAISELGDLKDKVEALARKGIYIPMELSPRQRAQLVAHILKYGI